MSERLRGASPRVVPDIRRRSARRFRPPWSRRAPHREVPRALRQCRHRGVLPRGCDRRLPRPTNRRICTPMLSWQASMIAGKDLLNQFKAASWKAPDELERFVSEAEAPQTADLLKLLDIVTGKAP